MKRTGKERGRGNKAEWPYMHLRLTQTNKRKHPKQAISVNDTTSGQRRRCDTFSENTAVEAVCSPTSPQ